MECLSIPSFIEGTKMLLFSLAIVASVLGYEYFCPAASRFPDLVKCVAVSPCRILRWNPVGKGVLVGRGSLAYYLSSYWG